MIPLEALLLLVVHLLGLVARHNVQLAEAMKVLPIDLQVAAQREAATHEKVMLVVSFAV